MEPATTFGVDIGLLMLRLYVGGMMIGHGSQKAFGAFGGLGPDGTATLFHDWGFRPGRRNVLLAATVELIAAPLLILGLATPLACAMIVGVLLVAVSVRVEFGIWEVRGGFELPLLYALVTAALAFTGPGRLSVDQLLGLNTAYVPVAGFVAVAVAVIAAYLVIASARRARTSTF